MAPTPLGRRPSSFHVDGNSTVLDRGQTLIEVPSGSEFYFTFSASDPNGLPVMIDVTSDKSEGWRHAGSDHSSSWTAFSKAVRSTGCTST
ncbi:MAG: hypothetical protein Ct9H300mP30_4580 [Methanobacteriota archaeon]|nr:MAG: hypothetical protein Ct9H300mP30_4580 [Euryarchaeota archaeon]